MSKIDAKDVQGVEAVVFSPTEGVKNVCIPSGYFAEGDEEGAALTLEDRNCPSVIDPDAEEVSMSEEKSIWEQAIAKRGWETARNPLEVENEALKKSLRNVLKCLDEHLAQAAHDSNVTVETLCPCNEGEAETARLLLAEIDAK